MYKAITKTVLDKQKSKIFCIGLSRTGTTSLHRILLDLGFKSVHFCDFLIDDKPDFSKCIDFDAFGDTPIPLLYKDLDYKYPNSKFIITIRQKQGWLKSMKWMLSEGNRVWEWDEQIHSYHERLYGTRVYDEEILSKKWEEFHREVFKYFSKSPNKLLKIKLEDNFDIHAICKFLDLPYRKVNRYRSNTRAKVTIRDKKKGVYRYLKWIINYIIALGRKITKILFRWKIEQGQEKLKSKA